MLPQCKQVNPNTDEAPVSDERARGGHELNVFCFLLISLFAIAFILWVIFARSNYATKYAPHADGWYRGGVASVEIAVAREDRDNAACASDVRIERLRCPYQQSRILDAEDPSDDRTTLHPYHTVDGILFLAAGFWSSSVLGEISGRGRVAVVCVYHMLGVLKSVSLRWTPEARFSQSKDTLPVGTLENCVVPK